MSVDAPANFVVRRVSEARLFAEWPESPFTVALRIQIEIVGIALAISLLAIKFVEQHERLGCLSTNNNQQ